MGLETVVAIAVVISIIAILGTAMTFMLIGEYHRHRPAVIFAIGVSIGLVCNAAFLFWLTMRQQLP